MMKIIVRRRFLEVGVALFRNPYTVRDTVKHFYRSMSMKALVIEEFGDSSKLKYTELAKPEPGEGEVKKKKYMIVNLGAFGHDLVNLSSQTRPIYRHPTGVFDKGGGDCLL